MAEETSTTTVHPLETKWICYYNKRETRYDDTLSYKDHLHKVGEMASLEEFRTLFSYVKDPSSLEKDDNLHVFREDTFPVWEDLPNGGTYSVKCRKKDVKTDQVWQVLVAAAIGEVFEEPGVIGVTLHVRAKDDSLTVWHRDTSVARTRVRVMEKIKHVLGVTAVDYKSNAQSLRMLSDTKKE